MPPKARTKSEPKPEPVKMPVCPYCRTEMKPFDYKGYYDAFCGWECKCVEIPKAEKQFGAYA